MFTKNCISFGIVLKLPFIKSFQISYIVLFIPQFACKLMKSNHNMVSNLGETENNSSENDLILKDGSENQNSKLDLQNDNFKDLIMDQLQQHNIETDQNSIKETHTNSIKQLENNEISNIETNISKFKDTNNTNDSKEYQSDSHSLQKQNTSILNSNRSSRKNPLLLDISTHILNPKNVDFISNPERKRNNNIYFYNKGYRFVYPYYHNFVTHCKGRWIGKTLPKVFSEEFKQYTEESIKEAMNIGAIKINSKVTRWDTPLQNRDFIENKIHRHEMPVCDEPIEFIQLEPSYFVVNKPASIPVHPCGQYRMGSLTHILENEYGMRASDLYPVHRLDRLTSGVLIIARTKAMATALAARIADHGIVKKCYLARIRGKFPKDSPVKRFDGDLIQPDKRERGKWAVVPNGMGKPCRTLFTFIKYNEDTNESIIMCSPVTGRTHQIRVHLLTMGFPISNDPNYGPEDRRREFRDRYEYYLNDAQRKIFEEEKEKYEQSLQENAKKRICIGENEDSRECIPVQLKPPNAMSILLKYSHLDESELCKDWQFQTKDHLDPNCTDCKLITLPRSENDDMIFLHSFGFEVGGIKVFSSIPKWANISTEDADSAWDRIRSWKDDEPNYSKNILEYSLKKPWKKNRISS